MLYKRHLFYTLEKYINHKNAIVVTGARQVGKTSLLKMLYKSIPEDQRLWFDFDNPLESLLFEDIDYRDIVSRFEAEGISKTKQKYIFIDEIQNFPEVTKIIKYHIDHYKIKYVVTGSASYYMKNLFPESLSGRKFQFDLHTLSFKEFLLFKKKIERVSESQTFDQTSKDVFEYERHDQDYQEYKRFGGFPEVVLTESIPDKSRILKNIFTSYFEKDGIKFGGFSEVARARDLILLLVQRVGSKLDITKISKELGVSRQTVYNYLHFLESTFFISLVPQFSKSIDRQIAGGKKVYFIDSGLLQELGNVSDGQILENTVHNQLKQYGKLEYYQTQKGKEVDFILDKKIAFEVKKKSIDSYEKNLKKLAKKLKITKSFVISEEYTQQASDVVYPQFI